MKGNKGVEVLKKRTDLLLFRHRWNKYIYFDKI